MSKGVIKANLGSGLYEVEIVRDIAAIDAKISDLSTKKQNIENKLAQSEDKMLPVTAKKLEIQIAELERIKSNNMIFEIESVTHDDSLAVGLEVGVIERREAHKVFRRYINEPAAYDEVRDGKVKAAAVMKPWSWLYDTLIMPVAEVWKPRYWNCTISAISEDKLTANVTVDPIKPKDSTLYPMSKREWLAVQAGLGETLSNYEKSKIGDKAIIDFVTNKDEPRLMIIGNTDDGDHDLPPLPDINEKYEIIDSFILRIDIDYERFINDLASADSFTRYEKNGVEYLFSTAYLFADYKLSSSKYSSVTEYRVRHETMDGVQNGHLYRADYRQVDSGGVFFGSKMIWSGWRAVLSHYMNIEIYENMPDSIKAARIYDRDKFLERYSLKTSDIVKSPVTRFKKNDNGSIIASGYFIKIIY